MSTGRIRRITLAVAVATVVGAMAQAARAQSPGWIADPGTGCRVWNPNPKPGETIAWNGPCENGLAHGRGTLQWFESGRPTDRYDGDYRDGRVNGRGVYAWTNGTSYEGDYRDDQMHGRGVLTFANGNRYEGEYRHDQLHGRGIYTWASGNRYDGDWRDGMRTGRGILTRADGSRYDGEWRDDAPNGHGTLTASGETYTGIWTKGCFQQGDRWATFGPTPEECGFK